MHDKIFAVSPLVRYVATYKNGQLDARSRSGTCAASAEESDRYEELLVNPTMLKLASQRGNIDCGGLNYLIVCYGNCYQFVLAMPWGHVSVCFELASDPVALGRSVISVARETDPA